MSSTSKQRLQAVLPHLDTLFANAHPQDVPDLAKELREQITLKVAAARRGRDGGYDRHVNSITDTAS